ncbi:MAG TPA: PepSY domain-containing protein [Sphingomicrobium sp.]
MSRIIMAAVVAGVFALPAIAATTTAQPPKPRISMAQARAKALKLAPGKIISSEYEREGGIWRYSFDIQQRGNVQEIGIDGRTGRVVENKSEGKKDKD